MAKGRTVPVIFALPRAEDPSLAIDTAFFERNPDRREYTRKYIRGETLEPMPLDTWVHVLRIGVERVRGFAPPNVEVN